MPAKIKPCHNCCTMLKLCKMPALPTGRKPPRKPAPARWFRSTGLAGTLPLLGLALTTPAQTPTPAQNLTLTVQDNSGAAVPGATVTDETSHVLGRTDAQGRVQIRCVAPCHAHIQADGFSARSADITENAVVRLDVAREVEQVTVTAYR